MSLPGCPRAGQDLAVLFEREGSLLASFSADRGEGSEAVSRPVAIVWPCPLAVDAGYASSPPRPSTAAPSPSSEPGTPPTSRPASTPCCSKRSARSPACSANQQARPAGNTPGPGLASPRRHHPSADPATGPASGPRQAMPTREHAKPPDHVQTTWPVTEGSPAFYRE